jgi:ATP-dependent Lon protease
MTILARLNAKREELENKCNSLTHSSVPKTILQNKIKTLNELINAYGSTNHPITLTESELILNQQVGFDEQKRIILEKLEITEFWEKRGVKGNPLILCLVGPSGVGKTTFAQIIAQALGKKFFSAALNGLSETSTLVGSENNSPANNAGQLMQALVETQTSNPVILLDEIDKASLSLKNCLLNILDPKQNHAILDYYLDVKLDFSQITFVLTANETKSLLPSLRDRMLIIEIPGYNGEQKKEIANKIIQQWFKKNGFNHNNLEITANTLEILINKTQEKGVRQLEMALNRIFDYCLLQWSRQLKESERESKIIITPSLANQIITHNFSSSEQEEEWKNKNDTKIQNTESLWFFLFVLGLTTGGILSIFNSNNSKTSKIVTISQKTP